MKSIAIGVAVIGLGLVQQPAARAELLTYQFRSTIDATAAGGEVDATFVLTYTFDTELEPGTGPFGAGENFASYAPISITLEVDDECLRTDGAGTGILVFDDTGPGLNEDGYEVSVSSPLEGAEAPTLFGMELRFARFLLLDLAGTMVSGPALPTTLGFQTEADEQQTSVTLWDASIGEFVDIFTVPSTTPFALSIFDPVGAITELKADVESLELAAPLENKLINNLDAAITFIGEDKPDQARKKLEKFADEVYLAMSKGDISAVVGAALFAAAQSISLTLPSC